MTQATYALLSYRSLRLPAQARRAQTNRTYLLAYNYLSLAEAQRLQARAAANTLPQTLLLCPTSELNQYL